MKRFSFNHATATRWPLPEMLDACVNAGVQTVGLWREQTAEYGLSRTIAHLETTGLAVSSMCRGGFFANDGWYDDNRRAIDETAAVGAPVLVLVCGGLAPGQRDLAGARAHVADAIGQLVPYAQERNVRLAIEPLHPMFASDRCVVSTLEQALDIAESYPLDAVGVVVDTYHIWWDERVFEQIERAGPRIASFQLADWVTPLPAGVLTGRGLPGTGCIDFSRFWRAVDDAGYAGPVEVEVFNDALWDRPGVSVLTDTIAAYKSVRIS